MITSLLLKREHFDWIAFRSPVDGCGDYNRYSMVGSRVAVSRSGGDSCRGGAGTACRNDKPKSLVQHQCCHNLTR